MALGPASFPEAHGLACIAWSPGLATLPIPSADALMNAQDCMPLVSADYSRKKTGKGCRTRPMPISCRSSFLMTAHAERWSTPDDARKWKHAAGKVED